MNFLVTAKHVRLWPLLALVRRFGSGISIGNDISNQTHPTISKVYIVDFRDGEFRNSDQRTKTAAENRGGPDSARKGHSPPQRLARWNQPKPLRRCLDEFPAAAVPRADMAYQARRLQCGQHLENATPGELGLALKVRDLIEAVPTRAENPRMTDRGLVRKERTCVRKEPALTLSLPMRMNASR